MQQVAKCQVHQTNSRARKKSQRFQEHRNSTWSQYRCCRNRNTKVARARLFLFPTSIVCQSLESLPRRPEQGSEPRSNQASTFAPTRQVLPPSWSRLHGQRFRGQRCVQEI